MRNTEKIIIIKDNNTKTKPNSVIFLIYIQYVKLISFVYSPVENTYGLKMYNFQLCAISPYKYTS